MNITVITSRAGAKPKRKRVGRGPGSGLGKTSGKGHKGQGARSGGRKERGLLSEGGVFPLFRRLPKVGFNNFNFRTEYQVVNVGTLEERFDSGGHVTAASLEELGLIRDAKSPVKILGDGEVRKKLTVEAERFSGSAAAKIEAVGGTVKRLGPQPKKKFVKRGPPTGKLPEPAEGAGAEGGEKPKKAKKAAPEGQAAEGGKKEKKKKAPEAEGGKAE